MVNIYLKKGAMSICHKAILKTLRKCSTTGVCWVYYENRKSEQISF